MKNRIKILFLLIAFICSFNTSAQKLVVIDSLKYSGSVAASEVPRDNNDNPCAKIIVEIPLNGVAIEGTLLVGPVKHKTGTYEFYVSPPKRNNQTIIIRHNNYSSCEIPLWVNGNSLVGREAYVVRLKVVNEELSFSQHNQFYADVFFQAGGLMGVGGAIGAHFHAVNAEMEFTKGISKSDEIFWYEQNKLLTSCSYSSFTANAKIGYGFQFKRRFFITPQAGFGMVKCTSNGDNPGKNANAAFVLVGCRGSFVFAKHLQVVIAPYYNFAIKKSSSFEEIAAVHSSIDKWASGFNVKVGLSVYF